MSVSSLTIGGKIKYKIVLLGDQYVGKTAVIDRFINDRFQDSYNATIGIDFLVRNILHNNKTYRLQLWDTAGQQRFKSLIPSYLKDSHCAIIVFDLNCQKSLENVTKWVQLYNQHKQYTAFSVLVGNKKDLLSSIKSNNNNFCSESVIKEKLKQLKKISKIPEKLSKNNNKQNNSSTNPYQSNYLFNKAYQISAKTGQGVQQLFLSVIQSINDKLANTKIIDFMEEKPINQVNQNLQEQDGGTTKVALTSSQLKLPQISLENIDTYNKNKKNQKNKGKKIKLEQKDDKNNNKKQTFEKQCC